MTEPLPCPFCGRDISEDNIQTRATLIFVCCPRCNARGPTRAMSEEDDYKTLAALAILYWNRRVKQIDKYPPWD